MKRKFLAALAVLLPVALFLVASEAASWRPQLVLTHPSGSCSIQWSHDGRTIRLIPNDRRQELVWGTYSDFDATTWKPVTVERSQDQRTFGAFRWMQRLGNEAPFWAIGSRNSPKLVPVQLPHRGLNFWPLNWAQLSANSKMFLLFQGGEILTIDALSGKMRGRVKMAIAGDGYENEHLSFSPDGTLAMRANHEKARLEMYDTKTGAFKCSLKSDSSGNFEWTPDGALLWRSGYREPTIFRDAKTGRKRWAANSVYGATLSPNAKQVAQQEGENFVMREVMTGRKTFQAPSPCKYIQGLAFSPDGKAVCLSDFDGKIWKWRLK